MCPDVLMVSKVSMALDYATFTGGASDAVRAPYARRANSWPNTI